MATDRRKLLTIEQEQTVRREIAAGATWAEAAQAAGVPYRRVQERKMDQLVDLRVGQGRRGGRGRAVRDPTPEEIAVAAAGVRKRWTPDRWGLHDPDAINDNTRHGREIRTRP